MVGLRPLELTAFALLALALAACGSDDGPGNNVDAAPSDAGTDAATVECDDAVVALDLGSPSGLDFRGSINAQGIPGRVYLDIFAQLDTGPVIDLFQLTLWEGLGAFSPDLVTGTYEITGDETDFYSCGVCPVVVGNFAQIPQTIEQQLMASSGTVQLDMVSTTVGQMVTGTLTNADFREVTLNDGLMQQTEVPVGCTTHIDSISFSAILVQRAAP